MSLDRQKILTELGSVISQLKNADCGCMGKLFENNRQMPMTTGHHCEAYGSHRPNYSECSHNMTSNAHTNMHFPCMGGCNAPKLYSETYNYLSENMMKPTVQEVYDDLKSITPANTIMNNPAAMNKMGLNSGWEGGQSTDAQSAGAHPYKISNYNGQNTVPLNNPQTNHFGGIGPQIMNMLQGNNANPTHQNGQITKPFAVDTTQLSQNENITPSPAHFMKHHNIEPSNPTNQFMNQPNVIANSPQQNMTKSQPSNPINTNQHSYGQHAQGIAKFNEMFPGIMKNDLGFDPMSIAIQMNPANQKQAAMQSIHDMMYNKNTCGQDSNANVNNLQQSRTESNMPFKQTHSESPTIPNEANFANQPLNNLSGNQEISMPNKNSNKSGFAQTSYQVYSGPKDLTAANQQQQMQQPVQYQKQNLDNPNIAAAVVNPPIQTLPTVNENIEKAYGQTANDVLNNGNFENINEPIYPVDTTKNITSQNYGYNTLGQPVKMLPAQSYHTPVPSLPQTLSPQPTMKYNSGYSKYSNVKSTVSKTSLLANRPIGKIASRNQIQQMNNQYKGSTSYTQQNLKDIPRSRETNSDGTLHAPQMNSNTYNQIPLEKIAGDSTMNNPIQDQTMYKTGQVIEQIGDAPSAKPINDPVGLQDPVINRKCRNGLQDMTFTSYPTSAAWSFHGCERAPPSAKYRYRNRF